MLVNKKNRVTSAVLVNVRLQLHTLGGSTATALLKVVTKEEDVCDVSQGAPRGRRAMDLIWISNLSQVGEFSHTS